MKDYKKLLDKITKEKEITISDITDLGYTRYDINQFIDAGILSRLKRGLYLYLPEINVEKTASQEEVRPQVDSSNNSRFYLREGVKKLVKRENKEAIELFEKALEIEPTNQPAKLYLAGAYIFLGEYEKAYEILIDFYNTRQDNSLIHNIYHYLVLLKQHTPIDENILKEIKGIIDNNPSDSKKQNVNYRKLHSALNNEDYLEALKYINFSISIDKKSRKYHITNHIYKALITSIIRLKGLNPFPNVEVISKDNVRVTSEDSPLEEETVIVPSSNVEDTIKQNILLEAINSNNYDLALTLLEKEKIDNPLEVIRILLTKLQLIRSLVTSNEPLKVVSEEPVRVVMEETLVDDKPIIPQEELVQEEPTQVETLPQEITPTLEVLVAPVVEQSIEEQPSTNEELIEIAYKAYKTAYNSEQFTEAKTNLRRYEYLCNLNGKHRNIKFHYLRIEKSAKDFEEDPERYLKKKELIKEIFSHKDAKRYEEALSTIAEYKSLGGIVNDQVLLLEVQIYMALGNNGKASIILDNLSNSEEPTFFALSSKLAFKHQNFEQALSYCQSFNERRPNNSPSNYQLMGECYSRLNKPGKAVKAYRKAEEVAASYGNNPLGLTSKINSQEVKAEFQREMRKSLEFTRKSKI